MTAYDNFQRHIAELSDILNAISVLKWDARTNMPPGGSTTRGYQLATLSRIAHHHFAGDETARILDAVEAEIANEDTDSYRVRAVRQTRPIYDIVRRIPAELLGRKAPECGLAALSLGVTPAMTALLAPFWGRLADRFGRKIMVERSLASFVLVMASMAFVTKAWHVFALRAIQGLFAGYGALTLTMAAETAPRDRMAQAIGQVQTAQRLGPALGRSSAGRWRRSSACGTRFSSPRGSMSSRSCSSSSCITSRPGTAATRRRRPRELPHGARV